MGSGSIALGVGKLVWLILMVSSGISHGQAPPGGFRVASALPHWVPSLRGGYVHQVDSRMEGGGKFRVHHVFMQSSLSYQPSPYQSVTLSLGYRHDHYDFSRPPRGAYVSLWGAIQSLTLSLPVRWGLKRRWALFVIPTLQLTSEHEAGSAHSLSGGGVAGVAYRLSNRFTLGPGIGILSRLDDGPTLLPIVLMDWKLTDRLRLSTGRGLAAGRGPELTLTWRLAKRWRVAIGAGYDTQRFRLNDRGAARRGVGQRRAFPLGGRLTYAIIRQVRLSFIGGMELGGRLRLDDQHGRKLFETDYDPSGFFGWSLTGRL